MSRSFPETRISVVTALSSDDSSARTRATELVIAAYRLPVIAVLQHRWNLDLPDAEDLAHDFFAQALAHDWLGRYDPARGRFRTFLRTCLLAFASTAHEAATRQKRGGAVRHVALDDAATVAADGEINSIFDREWARSVLTLALDAFRAECLAHDRESTWRVFSAYEIESAESGDRPTYEVLAREIGIPVTQVTNYLNWARRHFRAQVLTALRALTANDAEYREEVRALLGGSPE